MNQVMLDPSSSTRYSIRASLPPSRRSPIDHSIRIRSNPSSPSPLSAPPSPACSDLVRPCGVRVLSGGSRSSRGCVQEGGTGARAVRAPLHDLRYFLTNYNSVTFFRGFLCISTILDASLHDFGCIFFIASVTGDTSMILLFVMRPAMFFYVPRNPGAF